MQRSVFEVVRERNHDSEGVLCEGIKGPLDEAIHRVLPLSLRRQLNGRMHLESSAKTSNIHVVGAQEQSSLKDF